MSVELNLQDWTESLSPELLSQIMSRVLSADNSVRNAAQRELKELQKLPQYSARIVEFFISAPSLSTLSLISNLCNSISQLSKETGITLTNDLVKALSYTHIEYHLKLKIAKLLVSIISEATQDGINRYICLRDMVMKELQKDLSFFNELHNLIPVSLCIPAIVKSFAIKNRKERDINSNCANQLACFLNEVNTRVLSPKLLALIEPNNKNLLTLQAFHAVLKALSGLSVLYRNEFVSCENKYEIAAFINISFDALAMKTSDFDINTIWISSAFSATLGKSIYNYAIKMVYNIFPPLSVMGKNSPEFYSKLNSLLRIILSNSKIIFAANQLEERKSKNFARRLVLLLRLYIKEASFQVLFTQYRHQLLLDILMPNIIFSEAEKDKRHDDPKKYIEELLGALKKDSFDSTNSSAVTLFKLACSCIDGFLTYTVITLYSFLSVLDQNNGLPAAEFAFSLLSQNSKLEGIFYALTFLHPHLSQREDLLIYMQNFFTQLIAPISNTCKSPCIIVFLIFFLIQYWNALFAGNNKESEYQAINWLISQTYNSDVTSFAAIKGIMRLISDSKSCSTSTHISLLIDDFLSSFFRNYSAASIMELAINFISHNIGFYEQQTVRSTLLISNLTQYIVSAYRKKYDKTSINDSWQILLALTNSKSICFNAYDVIEENMKILMTIVSISYTEWDEDFVKVYHNLIKNSGKFPKFCAALLHTLSKIQQFNSNKLSAILPILSTLMTSFSLLFSDDDLNIFTKIMDKSLEGDLLDYQLEESLLFIQIFIQSFHHKMNFSKLSMIFAQYIKIKESYFDDPNQVHISPDSLFPSLSGVLFSLFIYSPDNAIELLKNKEENLTSLLALIKKRINSFKLFYHRKLLFTFLIEVIIYSFPSKNLVLLISAFDILVAFSNFVRIVPLIAYLQARKSSSQIEEFLSDLMKTYEALLLNYNFYDDLNLFNNRASFAEEEELIDHYEDYQESSRESAIIDLDFPILNDDEFLKLRTFFKGLIKEDLCVLKQIKENMDSSHRGRFYDTLSKFRYNNLGNDQKHSVIRDCVYFKREII